jgi:hypothetical protein
MRNPSPRAALLATALLLAAAASGCAPGEAFVPPEDPLVGKPAPPFVLHSVHQRSFPSGNFAGKTLVLIFVKPGQPEAQLLLREMERMHRDPAFAGIQFVAIVPENDPLTKPFWIGLKNDLPFLLDYTDVASRYGAGSLPLIVVRDYRDTVRLRLSGFVGKDFYPKLAAVRKVILEAEKFRTEPGAPSP